MKSYKVVALIPAWNESATIGEVVKRTKRVTDHVLVVDDGSTDDTAKIAKESGAVVIKHDTNKGKGEALRTGFNELLRYAFDFAIVVDSDMQYFPEDGTALLKPLENGEADFVMGKRKWENVPLRHRLGNFVWKTTFNILFGTRLEDTNCGFVAMTHNAMEKIKNIYGGYIIENSMLSNAIKNNLKVKQVSVRVRYKHVSHIPRGTQMVLGVLIFILREGISYRFGKH